MSSVSWQDAEGQHELDMGEAASTTALPVTLSRDRFRLPLNHSVVRFADAFIVHSQYVKRHILEERNQATPVGVLHHGSEFRWSDDDRTEMRRRMGLDEHWAGGFLVTSFGGVQPHKRIDRALQALALARREYPDIRMVLAGKIDSEGFDAQVYARNLGLADAVHFTGFVEEREGWDWLHAGDIALNLRGPSSGGTSGGIFQAFSMGRAVIASDACEQTELPDSCTLKVPLGDGEVETIARHMVELRNDERGRNKLEQAARSFVERECHWGIVAKQYAEMLEAFPRPRATRKQLIALGVTLQSLESSNSSSQ